MQLVLDQPCLESASDLVVLYKRTNFQSSEPERPGEGPRCESGQPQTANLSLVLRRRRRR